MDEKGCAADAGATGDTITVKVLAMNQPGTPLVLRCRLDDRVATLHRLAAAQHDPPLGPHEYLKLLYCGRMLRDTETLRAAALEDGCTVHAVLSKKPPGPASPQPPRHHSSSANNSSASNNSSHGQRRGLDALGDMGFSADDAAQMWALYRMETGADTRDPDAPRDYDREEQWLRIAAGERPAADASGLGRPTDPDRALQQLALLFTVLQQDEAELARIAAVPELRSGSGNGGGRGRGRRGARAAAAAAAAALPRPPTIMLSLDGNPGLELAGGFALGVVLGVLALLLLCELPLSRRAQVGILVGITCHIAFVLSIAGRAIPQPDDRPKP